MSTDAIAYIDDLLDRSRAAADRADGSRLTPAWYLYDELGRDEGTGLSWDAWSALVGHVRAAMAAHDHWLEYPLPVETIAAAVALDIDVEQVRALRDDIDREMLARRSLEQQYAHAAAYAQAETLVSSLRGLLYWIAQERPALPAPARSLADLAAAHRAAGAEADRRQAELYEAIREAAQAGQTGTAIAEQTGLTQPRVSQIIRGTR